MFLLAIIVIIILGKLTVGVVVFGQHLFISFEQIKSVCERQLPTNNI